MNFRQLLDNKGGQWLSGAGPEADVIISSRVRLARNLQGFPFVVKAKPSQRAAIDTTVREALPALFEERPWECVGLETLKPVDRVLLVERRLISRELADSRGTRSVGFDTAEAISLMINEEDHLRLQVLFSGFQLDAAFELIHRLDDRLDERLPYAFHPMYGYLTACPTNVGTGMRISVMVHLPALQISRHIEKVLRAAQKMNLVVRGLFGEGTQATGDFFQISSQITLGHPEEKALATLKAVVPKVVEYERNVRDLLLKNEPVKLEDRVHRALAILRNTRTISSEETMTHLSTLRMGVSLGILTQPEVACINEAFLFTQPAHLQVIEGRELEDDDRDRTRAEYLRRHLGMS